MLFRSYEAYPQPGSSPVTLFLHPGAPEQGLLSTAKANNPGTETLTDNYSFDGSSLARAEITDHRLIYVTEELQEDIHLSGLPEVSIRLSASKPAANLSVWLVSLPWNERRNGKITDNIITRGWADPTNHRSIRESEPLVPGQFYSLKFDMQPDDQIIPKGQKIGLMIFSSDKEFTVWPKPGTELTIDLNATSITLPIVGGPDAFINATRKK